MDGYELIVADAQGNEVERGVTGELPVRGHGVMRGYLDDPEATAAAIDARGFCTPAIRDDGRRGVRIVGARRTC